MEQTYRFLFFQKGTIKNNSGLTRYEAYVEACTVSQNQKRGLAAQCLKWNPDVCGRRVSRKNAIRQKRQRPTNNACLPVMMGHQREYDAL